MKYLAVRNGLFLNVLTYQAVFAEKCGTLQDLYGDLFKKNE